jgi:hypothetical protein
VLIEDKSRMVDDPRILAVDEDEAEQDLKETAENVASNKDIWNEIVG